MAPETMTVNDALWRIAELASRSSDPKWRGDRTQAMHDLEAAIHEVGTALNDCAAGLEGAQAAAEEAGAQARAARGERDRERARAAHWEAKATEVLEALAAHQTQAETAEADRDDDLRALRRAHQELSVARAALAGVEAERDEARSALTTAQTALATARTAQATARVETEEAEARRLAAEKARRLAESERDAALGALAGHQGVPEIPGVRGVPEIEVDLRTLEEVAAAGGRLMDLRRDAESPVPPPRSAEPPRLLHVVATLGHLLPDDLTSLLVPGTRVVRREGRLAALLAVPTPGSDRAQPATHLEEEQAARMRAEGFRVEWTGDCLAS